MSKSGFSIVELIVVMGITLTLLAIGSIAFIKPQQKANLDSIVNTLIADMKAEQTKAMLGESNSDYKIHFDSDRYILNGFTVLVGDVAIISNITFNNQDLIFKKGSGEVDSLLEQNSLDISNITGDETIKININKYGAIDKN